MKKFFVGLIISTMIISKSFLDLDHVISTSQVPVTYIYVLRELLRTFFVVYGITWTMMTIAGIIADGSDGLTMLPVTLRKLKMKLPSILKSIKNAKEYFMVPSSLDQKINIVYTEIIFVVYTLEIYNQVIADCGNANWIMLKNSTVLPKDQHG
jgi:hypothetical protein